MSDTAPRPPGDLLVGGLVVVVPAPRPPGTQAVLPERIVTVSHCLMDAPRHEFFGWFSDPDEAEASRAGVPGACVLAVGVRREDATMLLKEFGGPTVPYFETLRQMRPMPFGEPLAGYEVVGVEAVLDVHSWHCHDYAREAAGALGVTVNALGLLDDLTDAQRVRDWMLALPPAEQPAPVPWIVVALAEHVIR